MLTRLPSNTLNSSLLILLSTMFIVLYLGCDRGYVRSAQIVDVAGEILLDNQPLEGARVLFMPEDSKPSDFEISYGVTDADGKFKLKTANERVGAIVGRHRVFISSANFKQMPTADRSDFATDLAKINFKFDIGETWNVSKLAIQQASGEKVPFYYNFHSELTCEITPGQETQDVRFELESVDPMLK